MAKRENTEFEIRGINHLALVCKDMARTVAFYKGVLGQAGFVTAHGSMNHVAPNVPVEKFDEYCAKLKAKGIVTSPVMNHDNSKYQVSEAVTDDVFVRSIYFSDPDGVCLEFACWMRTFDDSDVAHAPVNAEGVKVGRGDVGASSPR